MDDRGWDALRDLMFEDATADVGAGLLIGSAAVVDCIRGFLDACGPTQHLLGNILVQVAGDEATSRAYVSDLHLGAGHRSHLAFSTLGDYHDSWERDGDGWRMRHRTKVNRAQVGTLEVFGIDDPASSRDIGAAHAEVLRHVYRYPELIDSGDFEAVGDYCGGAQLINELPDGTAVEVSGTAQVQAMLQGMVRRFPDDGSPHTRHVISNPIVELGEGGDTATCRYYITVFQRTDELPLQSVWANRCEDQLRRVDGAWRLERRRGFGHMQGDVSQHLQAPVESLAERSGSSLAIRPVEHHPRWASTS